MRRGMIFVFFLLMLSGCSPASYQSGKYSESRTLMGTLVRMDICWDKAQGGPGPQPAMDRAWDRLEEIGWRMSNYNDRSDVAKVNRSYGSPAEIGEDTYGVIKDSIKFSGLSGGAFDITVEPLIKLWQASAKNNVMPTADELALARSAVGVRNLDMMEDGRVQVLHEGTSINLGGIAKGYAVDEAARILRENGMENFMVDAGGDLYVGGNNCRGEPWHLGIRDPRDSTKILDVVLLRNASVVTSGDYERFYEVEGKKWSHIINPKTGFPVEHVASATVIAPTAEDADALATAVCVLGAEKGVELLDSQGEGYSGLIVIRDDQGEITKHESAAYKKVRLLESN